MDLIVGRIGRAHGVRGEVTIEVRTDDPDARFAVGSTLRTHPAERGPLTVAGARPRPGGLVVAFDGITDRAAADALRGTTLLVDSADLPRLPGPDEFYDYELVGLAAVLLDGTPLGAIREVVHAPGGDLLVVQGGRAPGGPPDEPGEAAAGDRGRAGPGDERSDEGRPGGRERGSGGPPDEPGYAAAGDRGRAAEGDERSDEGRPGGRERGRGPAGASAGADPGDGRPHGEYLVPFVRAIVPTVDVAGGRVVIDPPPGLLEL